MGTVSGFRTSRTGPEGNPLLKATIGMNAPFSFYDLGTDARLADAFTELALVI
jgi:hypothetical protein